MNRSTCFAIVAVWVPLLAASCSSGLIPSAMLPSSAERERSLGRHHDAWSRSESVKIFGLERSVEIVGRRQPSVDRIAPAGMATLVTRDGYTLTANHAVKEGFEPGVLVAKHGSSFLPVHIGTTRMTIKDADGRVKDQVDWPGAGGFSMHQQGTEQKVNPDEVTIAPLRVVRRFPALDLAIVHCGVDPASFFDQSVSPNAGSPLFASGNPFRYRASAAGEATKVKPRRSGGKSIHTSLPLSRGDSGSPVYDGRRLAGIVTNAFPKQLIGFPASIARQLDPGQLQEIIANDRVRKER